jgi:prefoldin alpha subunit
MYIKTKKMEHTHEHSKEEQREMLELNILDMQLRQLEQQSLMIEQQIIEQQALVLNLDELKKAKPGKTMLFPFSKDIFVEGKLESNEVIVNIGAKTFARKNIDGAKVIAEKQKQRLLEVNEEIRSEMQRILERISELEKKLGH